jgi:hypothetical protein
MTAPVLHRGQRVVRTPSALSAEIDGEIVALDVAKGACYGLDRIGSRIWSLISEPIAIEAVCAILAEAYDVDDATCERDVSDLLAELAVEGLVRLEPGPTAS